MKKRVLAMMIAGVVLVFCGCSVSVRIDVSDAPTTQPMFSVQICDGSEADEASDAVEPTTNPADASQSASCQHNTISTVTKEATCTEDGSITHVCSECGQELGVESIAAIGHSFENGVCKICGIHESNDTPNSPKEKYELPEDEL